MEITKKDKNPADNENIDNFYDSIFYDEPLKAGNREYRDDDVRSDCNSDLVGHRGSLNYDKMTKNDPIVGSIIRSFENPILSCSWGLEKLEDPSDKEEQAYDLIHNYLFIDNNFEEMLKKILKFLPMGFSCFEKYYKLYDYENNTYQIPVLEERLQKSILNIDYKKKEIEQRLTDGEQIFIGFDNLLFFTNDQQGDDKRGVSLVRNCYENYLRKRKGMLAVDKAIIRNMVGVPVAKYTGTPGKDLKSLNAAMRKFADVKSVRDYFIVNKDVEDFDIKTASFDLKGIKEYFSYLDGTSLTSVLAQFLGLGQGGNGGAFALGTDQSSSFVEGLKYYVDYIEQRLTKQVIIPALKMNFTDIDFSKYKLKGLNLNKKAQENFAKLIKLLSDTGAIKWTEKDENYLRSFYDLPELDDEDRLKRELKEKEGIPNNNEKIKDNLKLSETTKQNSNRFDREKAKVISFMKANLTLIGDKLARDINVKLKQGKNSAKDLDKVKISNDKDYKLTLSKKFAGIANDSYKIVKDDAKQVLKLAEDINPSKLPSEILEDYVNNQSKFVAEDQVSKMRSVALLTANASALKGYSNSEIIEQVKDGIDDFIGGGVIINGAALSTIESMNFGSMEYYKTIDKEIVGYKIENDNPTHPYCKAVVGSIISKEEVSTMSPPYHFGCNSFLRAVYKKLAKEDDVVNFKQLSKTIRKTRNIF